MNSENLNLIIILIVFGTTVLAVLTIVVVFAVINSKCKEFINAKSECIRQLRELNKKTIFKKYHPYFELSYKYDNKRNWSRTEPSAFLTKRIRDNLEYYIELREKIEFNRELFPKYDKEARGLYKQISPKLCATTKFKYKRCVKTERNIFFSLIQKPDREINIRITLRYVSRKGKVDLSKSQTFGYIEIVRILDSVSTKRVDRNTYEKLAKAERMILSDGMRYDVLKRDGFKCVLCGMSAKDGAILHVDHIIPISKGGKTEMSNLRTLCEKCNIGKSNKIE